MRGCECLCEYFSRQVVHVYNGLCKHDVARLRGVHLPKVDMPRRPRMESLPGLRDWGSTVCATSFTACRTRMCSFFNSSNEWSSWLCHGYRTKTWKPSADEATTKFVVEMRRVQIIFALICTTFGLCVYVIRLVARLPSRCSFLVWIYVM